MPLQIPVSEDIHRAAKSKAAELGASLRDFAGAAVTAYLAAAPWKSIEPLRKPKRKPKGDACYELLALIGMAVCIGLMWAIVGQH